MAHTKSTNESRSSEAGFTLVEALVAIVVLMVGIIAVTNLFVVAASTNSVASQSTGAAASASHVLDTFRATPFNVLSSATGGDLDADLGTGGDCADLGRTGGIAVSATHFCISNVDGVGTIRNRWEITAVTPRLVFIEVRSEGVGVLGPSRTRAHFTTFRACTDSRTGIPDPCPVGG